MEIVALILACIAALVFLFGGEMRVGRYAFGNISLGLALLTIAWIFQLVDLTGVHVTAH